MCWWQLELKRTRRCMLRPAGARAQSMLALEWREWMTRRVTGEYLANRAFYQVQAGALVDNPDQRIASDVRCAPAPHPCPPGRKSAAGVSVRPRLHGHRMEPWRNDALPQLTW
jgi:hypothetical protein